MNAVLCKVWKLLLCKNFVKSTYLVLDFSVKCIHEKLRYLNGLPKCTLHDFGFEVNELFRGDLKFHILVEIGLAREGIDLGFGQQGVRPWPGWTSKPIFQGRLLC